VEDSLGPGGPRFMSNGIRSRHYHDSGSEESRRLAPFQQKSAAIEDWHHQIEENQLRQDPVSTENSERNENSRVLGFAAIVFPASLSRCVSSSPFSPADSVAGQWWN
jgi:hypothetical protein